MNPGILLHITSLRLGSPGFISLLVPVVQKVDNAIHWINLYPVDNPTGVPDTYLLDSDLSSG